MKVIAHLPTLLKLSYQEWRDDGASRLAAALAYYTIFSLAPLLVIVIAITGLIWQQDVVRTQILNQIQGLVGSQGAQFVQSLITYKGTTGQGALATVLGIASLVFGALGVFEALHDSLNAIWDVREKPTKGFWQGAKRIVADRLLSFGVIIGVGFLLLVSLVVSTALTAMQTGLGNMLPAPNALLQVINLVISLGFITVLFALIFKVLPDAHIAWRDVWLGAFGTALLFSIGKTLIGLYLGNSNVASGYGAAGSLIVLLLWIYYSAQILFFGAEFTQVYANRYGSQIVPQSDAVRTDTPSVRPAGAAKTPPARQRVPERPMPATVPVTGYDPQLEKENRQTVRVLSGMLLASFLSGLGAAVYALKKLR